MGEHRLILGGGIGKVRADWLAAGHCRGAAPARLWRRWRGSKRARVQGSIKGGRRCPARVRSHAISADSGGRSYPIPASHGRSRVVACARPPSCSCTPNPVLWTAFSGPAWHSGWAALVAAGAVRMTSASPPLRRLGPGRPGGGCPFQLPVPTDAGSRRVHRCVKTEVRPRPSRMPTRGQRYSAAAIRRGQVPAQPEEEDNR